MRSNEARTEKRTNLRYVPYVAKKDEPKAKTREETMIRQILSILQKAHKHAKSSGQAEVSPKD